MDIFFEQIVAIKKNSKVIAIYVGILLLAIFLCAFLILNPIAGPLTALMVLAIGFGAYKLLGMLNIEYEYIVTNGSMDIDKIINKSKRQRISSFELSHVERVEKYNPSLLENVNRESVVFACNASDPNAFLMVASSEDTKINYIVFAPNDKLKEAIKKSLPKFLSNSAFK